MADENSNESSHPQWVQSIGSITAFLGKLAAVIGAIGAILAIGKWACESVICPVQPPTASFSVVPSAGPMPLSVRLNNTSTGDITKYRWDFGNGFGDDREQPLQHIYVEPGTYTISLTVQGMRGTQNRYELVIEVRSDSDKVPTPVSFVTPVAIGTAPAIAVTTPVPFLPIEDLVTVTPLEAFDQYFRLVEQKQHDQTWPRLTETWRSRFNAEGYEGYVKWVANVNKVDIINPKVLCQTAQWAVIQSDMTYHVGTGESAPYVQTGRYFKLRSDVNLNTWVFYDAGENPRYCNADTGGGGG